MNKDIAIHRIRYEYDKASLMFPSFRSQHEGLAIIWEEFEKLKKEVFKQESAKDPEKLKKEAAHIAAMALRFLVDLC